MEVTNTDLQTVTNNNVVVYDAIAVRPSCCMNYREGSGQITLRGTRSCQRVARYLVTFGANVALPTGADVVPINLAITINGEPVPSTTMISTPTAVEAFNNVSASTYIDVPFNTSYTVSVENTTGATIEVQNANLIAARKA